MVYVSVWHISYLQSQSYNYNIDRFIISNYKIVPYFRGGNWLCIFEKWIKLDVNLYPCMLQMMSDHWCYGHWLVIIYDINFLKPYLRGLPPSMSTAFPFGCTLQDREPQQVSSTGEFNKYRQAFCLCHYQVWKIICCTSCQNKTKNGEVCNKLGMFLNQTW